MILALVPIVAGAGSAAAQGMHADFAPTASPFPNYSDGGLPPAWGDYDNDGDIDLPLYRNDGNGVFSEIPGFRALLNHGNYHGASWCDYDRDGDLDLAILPYATPNPFRALLLRNQGDGTFVDVAPSLGMDVLGLGETAVWGDFDADGWPDLFTPYYAHVAPFHSFLFHNSGNGTFTDVAAAAGVDLAGLPESLKPEGAHAADYDDDGDLDLYCASHLFANDGNGSFIDVRVQVGLPEVFDEGAMFVDYDNDGDLDLSLRTYAGSRLFRNDLGHFTDVTVAAGLPAVTLSWGDSWADVDNDGDLDLYLVMHAEPEVVPLYSAPAGPFQPARLMLNQGDGTFLEDPSFDFLDSSGLTAWGDYDRDGDLDLFVTAWDRHLFTNLLDGEPGFQGSYLRVVVLDGDGNRTQQGATVRLWRLDGPPGVVQTRVVDGGSGYLTQSEYAVHFGVAPGGTFALEVSFPSHPASRVVVDSMQVPWLGSLVPGTLASPTITILRDGRAHLGDRTITATAGSGGTTTPSGVVPVNQGASQGFTIAAAAGHHITDVVVDGVSVGPLATYTFTGVAANHTIAASFAVTVCTLSVSVVGSGSVTKSPDLATYAWGSTVELTALPGSGLAFGGWSGDASGVANPIILTMDANKVVTAAFGDTVPPSVAVVAPNGGDRLAVGTSASLQWTAADDAGVTAVDLLMSRGGAAGPYDSLAIGIANSGSYAWRVRGPVTSNAIFKVRAHDAAGHLAEDVSDASFAITGIFAPASTLFPPYSAGTLPPAWGDYDNDGDVDLPLYRNGGNGVFTEIPGFRTLMRNGNYHGASWCDYDRDGDLDLALLPFAVVNPDRALLLRNQSNGTFVDVAPSLGMDVSGFGGTAVWGDFDADGWPDLFTPYYAQVAPFRSFLFHNNGNGTFTDVSAAAGVDLPDVPQELKPEGAHAVDYDDDGDLDLYCASHLFANDGSGSFTDVRAQVGLPETLDEGAMFVDYDNDGDLDLSLRTEEALSLFRNDTGHFTDVTVAAGLPAVGLIGGDSWADVDNDGDLDLYLTVPDLHPNLQRARLMLNQGDGTFLQDSLFNFLDSSGPSAWADYDRDGDLDLLVEGQDRHLFANVIDRQPGFQGSYLPVVVLDGDGNRTQQGATVRLRRLDGPPGVVQTRVVDGGSGYLTQSEYAVHFGVAPGGTYALAVSFPSHPASRVVVDSMQVRWLGRLVPGALPSPRIIVQRDGQAFLAPMQPTAGGPRTLAGPATLPILAAPAPNPTRDRVTLTFNLRSAMGVSFTIHDIGGRVVRRTTLGELPVGQHDWVWDGRDDRGRAVPSGVYLGRLMLDGAPAAERRILMLN
jgi:hypothetical protein